MHLKVELDGVVLDGERSFTIMYISFPMLFPLVIYMSSLE